MNSVSHALPQFLGGLDMFFLGLDWVKSSLKGLASRWMRRRTQAMVRSPVRASLFGLGFGAVSQLTLLATQAEALPPEGAARQLAATLVDSADLILHQLLAVMEHGEAVDREMLQAMTQDRGEQMESLRQRAAAGHFGSAREQASVLYAATLFERVVYLIRRLAGC